MDSITDHEYFGNMCSGFGGKTECEHLNFETGERCGKSPLDHGPQNLDFLRKLDEHFTAK